MDLKKLGLLMVFLNYNRVELFKIKKRWKCKWGIGNLKN